MDAFFFALGEAWRSGADVTLESTSGEAVRALHLRGGNLVGRLVGALLALAPVGSSPTAP